MIARALLLSTALLFAPAAFAQESSGESSESTAASMQVSDPQEFATMATVSNLFEIQSSELALEASESEAVKEFAQHMIEDHTAASQEMMAAAEQQGGVSLPDGLDEAHQEQLAQLQAASGDEFDQMYIQMQVQAHEMAVSLFSSYAESGEDGPLKTFASETLPTLQEHYESVQGMGQQ